MFKKFFGIEKSYVLRSAVDVMGVAITDDELHRLQTVGQLHDFTWARIKHAKQTLNGPEDTFHWLQVYLTQHLNLTSGAIQRETDPNTLLPKSGRVKFWKQVQKECPLTLPDLDITDHRWRMATLKAFGIMLGACVILMSLIGHYPGMTGGLGLGLGYLVMAYRDKRFSETNMIEFANEVLWRNGLKIGELIGYSRADMEQIIDSWISHHSFKNAANVTPDKAFPDFGFY